MRLVLVNAHWNNRGDEAALYALIEQVYKIDPTIKIDIIFKETPSITQFLYEGRINYIITRFRPEEEAVKSIIAFPESCNNADMLCEMDFLRGADIVIYAPGGGVISDSFWWTKQLEYLFPIAYAQSCGIKTIFAAPSIGPFYEEHSYRNKILCKVDKICLREGLGGSELISSTGGTESANYVLGNDLAFLGTVDMEKNKKIFKTDLMLMDQFKKYEKIVGMTITDLSWNVAYIGDEAIRQIIENSFKKFICWLGEKNIGVIIIPQLFGEQNDKAYLVRYQEAYSNVYILDQKYDSEFQQYLISKCYSVVGLRYHSNIFAAKMGIPMIPVIYEQKMRGFCMDSGIYEWAVEIQELSPDILINKFKNLEEEYACRKRLLSVKYTEWIMRSEQTIKYLSEMIRSVNSV